MDAGEKLMDITRRILPFKNLTGWFLLVNLQGVACRMGFCYSENNYAGRVGRD